MVAVMDDFAPASASPLVVTLVAPQGGLDAALLQHVRAELPETTLEWRAHARAADLMLSGTLEATRPVLAALLEGYEVDFCLQPRGGRRKRLFLADMDSTMIGQECIDELADKVGLKARVSAITERSMRGEIAFEPALRERVALLKGLPASVCAELIATRITLNPGARALVQTMRANGVYCALVSGGFTLFTGPIAEQIGFNEHRSNLLEIHEGCLTGTVADPILDKAAKRASLIELRDTLGLAAHQTLAVGDGANDLDMLGEAGLGVAYYAKPVVAAAAHARIQHTDLRALLYFQGYSEAEIVGE